MTLPQGWAEAALGETCDVLRGVTYDKADARSSPDANLVPVARATNIQSGRLNRDDLVYVPESCVSGDQFLREGDMVIATSSGSKSVVGKAARAGSRHGDMAFGAFCGVVRPTDTSIGDWIARIFEAPEYRTFVESVAIGTNINNLRSRDLRDYRFPVPPEAEQRRIVAKLDALTARLARARAELDRVPVLAAELRARTLSYAFDGKFVGDSVAHRPCDEWIVSTFYGPRFGKDEYVDQGIPTARTTDFTSDGTMCLEGAPQVACSDADFAKWGLVEGDLLVTRTGSIGKCAIYSPDLGRVLPSAYLIRVRFNSTILTRFAWMMFASPQGQEHLGVNSRAVTQPNINASAIRSLPFPALDVAAQQDTIDAVDRAFARVDRLKTEAARARALLDRLESALLAKAFRGELVPQDPNDKPAQALLDRIRAQRAAAPKAKRGRRAKVAA